MRATSLLAISAATIALQACGSNDPAPIVYGTPPTTTGRIYNSPQDYERLGLGAPTRLTASSAQPASIASQPLGALEDAPMRPMRATIDTAELPVAPTYVAGAETGAPSSGGRVIVIQPGDTVYAISRRTGVGPQAIIAENGLRQPYHLEVGATLRIPDPQNKIENRITLAPGPAPSAYAAPTDARAAGLRTVRSGDTLYSISRATGVSVQAIAAANNLRPPYALEVGDRLRIPAPDGRAAPPAQREARAGSTDVGAVVKNVNYVSPAAKPGAPLFAWPLKGAIIGEYGSGALGRRNDGINIAAPVGTPVRAAADGEVVYRGSELDGYGNLLLIKHADGYVTAYAHNDVMLVQKGQPVRQGQVIAKVGQTGSAAQPQLHFEIRQNLKAVDPKGFLDGQ